MLQIYFDRLCVFLPVQFSLLVILLLAFVFLEWFPQEISRLFSRCIVLDFIKDSLPPKIAAVVFLREVDTLKNNKTIKTSEFDLIFSSPRGCIVQYKDRT